LRHGCATVGKVEETCELNKNMRSGSIKYREGRTCNGAVNLEIRKKLGENGDYL